MLRLNKMIMGFAAVAVVSTVAVSAPLWAQALPNADNTVAQQGASRGERGNRGNGASFIDRTVVKDVIATTLNMTVEELDAAKEAGQTMEEVAEAQGIAFADVLNAAKGSMTTQVNDALTAGEITQQQADKMLEHITNMDSLNQGKGHGAKGNKGRGSERGNRGNGASFIDRTIVKDVIATTLNMTVEELDAANEAGQTMEEVAEAQGIAFADVLNAAKGSMTTQVNDALTAGEITQQQADKMLEHITNMDSLGKSRGRGNDNGAAETEEVGTDEETDSTGSLTRGTTFSTSSVSLVATDFIYLPSIANGPN